MIMTMTSKTSQPSKSMISYGSTKVRDSLTISIRGELHSSCRVRHLSQGVCHLDILHLLRKFRLFLIGLEYGCELKPFCKVKHQERHQVVHVYRAASATINAHPRSISHNIKFQKRIHVTYGSNIIHHMHPKALQTLPPWRRAAMQLLREVNPSI